MRSSHDAHRPQRRHAKPAAAAWREKDRPARLAPCSAGSRLLRRPDPGVLSEAIPLFFIGRNSDGFWVARDADKPVGGIFFSKNAALRFAKIRTAPVGCATTLVPERFELDVENQGSVLVEYAAAAMRKLARHAPGWTTWIGNAVAIGKRLIERRSAAFAERRNSRTAIERELFGGQYKLRSKNDDEIRPFI